MRQDKGQGKRRVESQTKDEDICNSSILKKCVLACTILLYSRKTITATHVFRQMLFHLFDNQKGEDKGSVWQRESSKKGND